MVSIIYSHVLPCRSHFTPADEGPLRDAVRRFFPGANGRLLSQSACMFTNTPDKHFIIDRHPRHPQVLLCSACRSGGLIRAVSHALLSSIRVGAQGCV